MTHIINPMKNILCLVLGTFMAITACSNSEKQNTSEKKQETVTVSHALGTVEVPLNPQRVVVLDYGALENLDFIGANVVGIPKTGLPEYLSKYKDDAVAENLGNLVEVNLEKINELQPDLIVLGTRLSDNYETMAQIAPTILPSSSIEGPIQALEKNLETFGKIFNTQDEYAKEMEAIKEKVAALQEEIQQSNEEALIVLHNRGRFSAYGNGSRFGLAHDALGIKEAAEDLETHVHGTRVSNEFIQQTNPDILFVIDRSAALEGQPLNKEELENPLIQKTNAFKDNKIVYLNPHAWYLSAGGGITSLNIMLDEVAKAFDE